MGTAAMSAMSVGWAVGPLNSAVISAPPLCLLQQHYSGSTVQDNVMEPFLRVTRTDGRITRLVPLYLTPK
jgi:hypothetical protein